MPRYRLFAEDGADIGETRLAVYIGPDDLIHIGAGRRSGLLTSCRSTNRTRRTPRFCGFSPTRRRLGGRRDGKGGYHLLSDRLTGDTSPSQNPSADYRKRAMSVIEYGTTELVWQTTVEVVAVAGHAVQQVEEFIAVGTPADRALGASIVDDFAEDLRRLADA
jgi:hypothetical protein